jgi:hypothetical protein
MYVPAITPKVTFDLVPVHSQRSLREPWLFEHLAKFAKEIFFAPSGIVLSSSRHAEEPEHEWIELDGTLDNFYEEAVLALLEIDGEVLVLKTRKGPSNGAQLAVSCAPLAQPKECTDGVLHGHARAFSSVGSTLVVYGSQVHGHGDELRLFSVTKTHQVVWKASFGLGNLKFMDSTLVAVALSRCLTYFALAGEALHLFGISKGETFERAEVPLHRRDSSKYVGVFFRSQHVVVVQPDKVTYFSLPQLSVVVEFSFGLPRPVRAAACRDELWAVIAGRDAYICQDQFYIS